MSANLSPGEAWPDYYRGYRLQTNQDGDVWWQVYQGTDRLFLDPTPNDLIEDLHSLKRLGGRVRVTEDNDVVTRVENDDGYDDIYVGELSLDGILVPKDEPQYGIDVRPSGLSEGDLWPSVYDGARYSFAGDHVWWQHPRSHKRHPVETILPNGLLTTLQRFKPHGGSFRVTPWNDVITLVTDPPDPDLAREQLHDLPRVVQNIIVMRRERGVEMLPVFVGSIDTTPIEVGDPRSLTDALTPSERAQLDSWAGSIGPTSTIDPDDFKVRDEASDRPADDPEDW